jgi:CheY-like chemotaxis protein
MINQTILLKQLRKRGVVAEAANQGQAAVDRLRQVCSTSVMPSSELDKPFDVVLMDLEMPSKSNETGL